MKPLLDHITLWFIYSDRRKMQIDELTDEKQIRLAKNGVMKLICIMCKCVCILVGNSLY